jgi:hypothetical protein
MDAADPRRPTHRGPHPLASDRRAQQEQAEEVARTMAAQRVRDESIAHAAAAFAGLCMSATDAVDKLLLGREVEDPTSPAQG